MDSIFAISFGLGLRFLVDAVSDHDFKITGTIVGLWEGVIMLHFTKKMPKSSDPFIAYGVRLFVDFLCTESVTRLVLVLVWTALGMVLADVTPAIWYEVGLRRVWRRFRRDIYTISRMIPTVAFFPPTRTVRFSPSREPSTITDADADADAVPPPSVIMTEQTPTTNTVPTTTAPATRDILRRRVPGYFPADFSDTETELGSVRAGPSPGERTSRRLSVYPGNHDFEDSVSSQNDLDEGNLSSVSSASTETPGVSSTVIDASTIPDMFAEEALVDVVAAPVKDEEVKTPKQSAAPYMPPTPSDSAMHLYRHPPSEDPLVVRPPSASMPQIPDFLDEGNTEDWEKIQLQEATEGKPPTPPAKDPVYQLKVPIIPAPVPPQPQLQRSTPSPEDEAKEWDMLESQFISNPNDNPNAPSNDHQGQTYGVDDDDDMYGDVAPEYSTFPAMGESSTTEPPPVHTTDFTSGVLGPDPARTNPWAMIEEKRQMDEEAERQQRESEEAARIQKEAEDALKEEQEEEARKLEEQRLKEKKTQERAERLKKEAEDEVIRRKKREEDEAAERKKKEEDEAAERRRKQEEAAAERQRKEEEAEQQRKAEAERQRKEEAERQRKEEAEQQRKEEAERQRKEEEAEAEERRKQEEERQKKEEEKQKKQEEKQRRKEEAEQKKREEADRKRVEEEEKEKEKAKKFADAAEAKRLREEAAEKKRLEEEADAIAVAAALAQAMAEAERQKEKEAEAQRLKEAQEAAIVKAEEDARPISEKEKQIKEQEEASQKQAEEKGRTGAEPSEPVPPNDAEQGLEKTLPPSPTQPIETEADAATEMSAASDPPSYEPSDRLDRMLLLRAQMVQMEGHLKGLTSPDSDQEIKQTEKILRKMRRQAERRYAAGVYMFPAHRLFTF